MSSEFAQPGSTTSQHPPITQEASAGLRTGIIVATIAVVLALFKFAASALAVVAYYAHWDIAWLNNIEMFVGAGARIGGDVEPTVALRALDAVNAITTLGTAGLIAWAVWRARSTLIRLREARGLTVEAVKPARWVWISFALMAGLFAVRQLALALWVFVPESTIQVLPFVRGLISWVYVFPALLFYALYTGLRYVAGQAECDSKA
ncbi:hypothetical protein [Timonella senegalensis]|uniref:hypothetical protein n=1 Tax=Timonella senegalensis TaxID=1465825 RepID=UPI0028B1D042|nr:hypothetical protein [Timonella senegalensis]